MNEIFARTEALIGDNAMKNLRGANVCLFGVGGVGSYTAEALARSGVGCITLVDGDVVSPTNINRQLIALHSTIGCAKVDTAKERIADINPDAAVTVHRLFYCADNACTIDFSEFDYVIDAIDTVTSKLIIIAKAVGCGVPVISCMGAGNKLDPSRFEVADISKTTVCPLARVMRRELRALGIEHVKVVYSKEEPVNSRVASNSADGQRVKAIPGSISFVPSAAGLVLAGTVIRDLCGI